MTPDTDKLIARAEQLGREHGRASGSWVIDGNTTAETARAILTGWEDCDPEIMDMQPAPLSGEWADGMTPQELIREIAGESADYDLYADHPLYDAACDAYEGAFEDAFWLEVRTSAESVVA